MAQHGSETGLNRGVDIHYVLVEDSGVEGAEERQGRGGGSAHHLS